MCEREILALYQQLHTKHYIKRYKQQVYKFTKTTIAIRFNILQVFPSVPALCLCYFHVSLNLVAALTFSILLSKFRDSTAPCSLTTMRLGATFCSSLTYWLLFKQPNFKALLKASLNCGFIIPYIIGFTKQLVFIMKITDTEISLGITNPAVSRLIATDTVPHDIRNTQTTVKQVFKSLTSVSGRAEGAAPTCMLWAFRF